MKNLSKYIILALCGTMLFVQCDILNPPITFSTTSGNVLGVFPNGTLSPLDSVKIEVDGSVRDISKADGTFSVSGLTAGKSYRFRLLGRGDLLLDSTITIQANDASLPKDKQTAKALSLKVRLTGKELDARFFRFPLAVGNQWNYEVSQITHNAFNGNSYYDTARWKANMSIIKVEQDGKDTLWHFAAFDNNNPNVRNVICRQTDSLLYLWNTPPRPQGYAVTLLSFSDYLSIRSPLPLTELSSDTLKIIIGGLLPGNNTSKLLHKVGLIEISDIEAARMNGGISYSRQTIYKLTSYTLK